MAACRVSIPGVYSVLGFWRFANTTHRWIAALSLSSEGRTPQSGEVLILSDGRRFRMSNAEADVRGWWFTATALNGASILQSNLELEWDAQDGVWRPAGAVPREPPDSAIPASMRRVSSPKRKQLD